MKFPRINIGLRIPLFYLLFGGLWILLSDRLLAAMVQDPVKLTEFQSYKGWAFVAASALFIYSLLQQYLSYQRQAEKKVRESEERLRLTLEAANQGIYDLNIKTGETIINDIYAIILGYDPATFVETNTFWLERLHPDDREQIEKTYRAYINNEIPEYRVEFRQRTFSGEWKWILSIGSIVERDKSGRPLRMLGTHTDITETKNALLERLKLLEESKRRLERIEVLREIDSAISSNQNLDNTLITLLGHIKTQLGVDAVAVLLNFDDQNEFRYASSLGFHSNRINTARVKLGESLAGNAAQKGAMIHLSQIANETIDPAFASLLADEEFQEYFGFPLIAKKRLIGVMELYNRSPMETDEEWLGFSETLAGQTAIAIENTLLFEGLIQAKNNLILANSDLVQAYDDTIESLAKAIDLRDKETEDHSRRVTKIAEKFARKMGFQDEEIIHIRRGALLHDIGKLGISDQILNKNGILTDKERIEIKKHPHFAYEMLKNISYLQPAIEIPFYHHEKWDGTGYPNGIKGEEIPKAARMFAIVDVFEALTSERTYRPAWTWQQAVDYIQSESGNHFDPEVVSRFMEFLEENPTILVNP